MSVRIGGATPVWGTKDTIWGIISNFEDSSTVEENELQRGDGEHFAIEQTGKRLPVSFDYTYKTAAGPDKSDVGTGTPIVISQPEAGGDNLTVYVKSAVLRWQKGDFKTIAIEATAWPYAGEVMPS